MRVIHVSDLHFGSHSKVLANNLRDQIAAMRPDMIVCTGDLADEPDKLLVGQALDYLTSLQDACAGGGADHRPKLMVVPGNHDVRRGGFLDRRRGTDPRLVPGDGTDYYSDRDNVWLFGFDSASEGKVGGSGFISDADVVRFHTRYQELEAKHKSRFTKDAVKIVAVHHHPLPVTHGHDFRARWLTMTNAGLFLGAVLVREVDLVLHGHEHIQAQARLWSSIGANARRVCIVSLGSTLRQLSGDERNWFGVIDASPEEVVVRFHKSGAGTFLPRPEPNPFHVRSRRQSAKLAFENKANELGYSYQTIASICVLNKDGDARRTVECEGLAVTQHTCERASRHPIKLPYASGHVSALRAETISGRQVTPDSAIRRGSRDHDFETVLRFDGPLAIQERMSYRYEWEAVNSFALDEREFDFMYKPGSGADNVEFSHYVVADPATALTVIVQLPGGFLPRSTPRVRVTEYEDEKDAREWTRHPDVEQSLAENLALRYFETLQTVALRVPYPRHGLSYGIEWLVPPALDRAGGGPQAATCDQLRRVLNRPLKPEQKTALQDLLVGSIGAARASIVQTDTGHEWPGPLEASFMIFDGQQHLLSLAAVVDTAGDSRPVDYEIRLRFGDGIAGRAFKANEVRFFDAQRAHENDTDYYAHFDNGPTHDVLVAFPIGPPTPDGGAGVPYAVFDIGSEDPACPLRFAPSDLERQERLRRFHDRLNGLLFERLTKVLLDR